MQHNLKYIKRVKARGKEYLYFDTGAVKNGKPVYKRLPDPKSREFGGVYSALLGHRNRRAGIKAQTSVTDLIALYEKSSGFRKLAANSQRLYSLHLAKVAHEMGDAPAGRVEPRDIARMMDKLGDKPATANLVLATVSAMYSWARAGHRQYVPAGCDPTRDIEKMEVGEHKPWPDHILHAALESENQRVRLATHLLYYTAQRIGDVVNMRWSDIRDGVLHISQQKTGKDMRIHIHRALADELARTPKRAITILTTQDGKPIGPQRVRIALKSHCAAFGLDLVPHGLRKNAVIALLEAGCSVAETASISGQSFQMVEYYAKLRDQGKLSAAAVLKWERNVR
ncbi:tyrosine-type recombinase/integrase [Sphingopyxis sp. Geo48]|uniref:tyrosine-type recombinase/integrase n=1 Tax=Sphingopyxis sp. Geo48 TaxID=545241 RepID=UPI0024B69AB5|nr:tyrosine-type recombinase/integrase [Sphingopyxis sp. Geo48]